MLIKFTYKQLILNNVHVGQESKLSLYKSSWFFLGLRQNVYIIDLHYTFHFLRLASNICISIVSKKGMILFVNNFKVMSDLIEKWAKKCGQPFSSMKWFNGCLTNIKVLFRLFVKIYRNARKAKRYYYYLYGLRKMSRLPNIVFLSSINQSLYVKSECLSLKIPTIALVDTTQKTFCYSIGIPANDQSLSSLLFFFMILNKSVIFGKYSCILSIGKAMKKKKWYNMFLNEDFLWWQERLLYIYLYKIKNNSNMRKKYLRLKKKETKLLKYNYGFKNDITIGKLKWKGYLIKKGKRKWFEIDNKRLWKHLASFYQHIQPAVKKKFRASLSPRFQNYVSQGISEMTDVKRLLWLGYLYRVIGENLVRCQFKDVARLGRLYFLRIFLKSKIGKFTNRNYFHKKRKVTIYKWY